MVVGVAVGCGSGATASVVPVPALARTNEAQAAFHRLETAWADAPPERRSTLAPALDDFLARYPSDDRTRTVRLYRAMIALAEGRLAEAHGAADAVRRGPPGATHDFAEVVEGAVLRRQSRPKESLTLLLPLRQKLVDTDVLGFYSDELVRDLVALGRFDEAVVAMLEWAEEAPAADRDETVTSIEALVRETPAPALEAGLRVLQAENPRSGAPPSEAKLWLRDAIRARLERVALAEHDPELARRLVESRHLGIGHDDAADALAVLAETSAVLPRVAGRAIGVVLDVTDDASKRRSAEVVEGMTRALGLPAALEREDSVHLVTRDAEDRSDIERALAALAGDGASILVAGVSDEAAVAAAVFADRSRIPVIVLGRPPDPGAQSFAFALGESSAAEGAAIESALASLVARNTVRVGGGGVPCDSVAGTAGGPRFPVKDWKRAGVDTLVFLGDPACTRDASLEASRAAVTAKLLLGLESAEVRDVSGAKFVVSAGRFPFGARSLGVEERAWLDRWGSPPSWYEALGHDAAVLGVAALGAFPLERAEEAAVVARLHDKARAALSTARASLWSTTADGFEGKTAVPRSLEVVPVAESAAP